jgi:hypothetical protein
MKAQSSQDVYDGIIAHIRKQGGGYPKWYCGIASDWEDRLFNDHNVPHKDYWHIACRCYNDGAARRVESSLVELGCDGGPGEGDETTAYVYAYLKGTMTNP